MNVGIHGIGVFLPDEVRPNGWWPQTTVEKWRERPRRGAPSATPRVLSDGAKLIVGSMAAMEADLFRGARERRVAPAGTLSSDLEAEACRRAIAKAGVSPSDIGLLLTYSASPDQLGVANACAVHQKLDLPESCFAMATESGCNSFLMQLSIARRMIEAGAVRYALLAQSCVGSQITARDQPVSAWFGDGAAAVVVGPVSDGRGILAEAHRVNGKQGNAVCIGVPAKRWFEEGRSEIHFPDMNQAKEMFLSVADRAEIVHEALQKSSHTAQEVDFYACHQGTSWLRDVTQRHLGLDRARSIDTFPTFASLSAANIPLVFSIGEQEGMLRDGDLVSAFSGGAGESWSAVVLRWGR